MSKKISDLVLAELKRFTYEQVLENSASEKVANLCMHVTIKCIALNFKGRNIYIPFIDDMESERKQKINSVKSEFNGSNHAELAIKHKRSLQWVYTVLKEKTAPEPKKKILIHVFEEYLPAEFILIGIPDNDAKSIAKSIARHLQQNFSGITFCINDHAFKQAQQRLS